jgi:hypothetical protein
VSAPGIAKAGAMAATAIEAFDLNGVDGFDPAPANQV